MVPILQNEAERLAALRELRILGTAPEPHFDAVCRTTSALFSAPIALVALVEESHQWFKAKCGLAAEGTSREAAFCSHTILSDDVLVVEDARQDPRFAANPLVTGEPHIRFYAGAPLILRPGLRVGTLCIIDTKPRTFSLPQQRQLQDLAEIVVAHLRLHEANMAKTDEIAHRQAHEDLVHAQAQELRASMGEGLTLLDRDFRVLDINAEAVRLVDRTVQEMVGQTYWYAWPGRADSELARALKLSLLGNIPVTIEHSRPGADGQMIWLETRTSPSGNGLTLFHRDVSERKQSEARLREAHAAAEASAAAHAAILGQLAEGVIVTDANGRITFVNEAAAALHGVARLDVAPDAYSDTYHLFTEAGETYVPYDLPLARAVRGETVQDARWRIRRLDGTEVLAIGGARPIRGPYGTQIGAVLTLRDDTGREAAERALRNLNATLADRVAERTKEAEASRAEAETAAQAKGEFLASMSHELRTPLNSIIGFSALMLGSPDLVSPMLRRYAGLVQDASATLLSIVNDVLDVSKLEAGGFELDPHRFSPRDLVQGAVALMAEQAKAKGLALHVETDLHVPAWLIGDDARLRQVLLNLLSNAVKFTARGMVWLHVIDEGSTEHLARIRFTVLDTGIGIPQDKRHRLFQRFSQVDSSTARQFGGSGLGLSICKSLIEIMGGTIEVESTEGEGSSFSFALELPVAVLNEPKTDLDAVAPALQPSRGAHILLAEDVVMNQELAVAMLTRWGHTVDVVADGAAAVDAVMRNRYDLVLMDVQMPVIDGLEATRRIRRLGGAFETLPIIAMTANVMARDVEWCRAAGTNAHIGKPFVPDNLRAVIAHWIGATVAGRSAGPTETLKPSRHDTATFDDLVDMIGADKVVSTLGKFVSELDHRLADEPSDALTWRTVGSDAHALVSTAGMLGFDALSLACRTLEELSASVDADGIDARTQLRLVREEVTWAKVKAEVIVANLEAQIAV